MRPIKVLCVESHPEYLGALSEMLQAAGYDVISATSGEQALKVLEETGEIGGILLEYDLPDVVGTTVRIRMKEMRPDLPVLLFAGVGSETPFLLRFFEAFLHQDDREARMIEEFDA